MNNGGTAALQLHVAVPPAQWIAAVLLFGVCWIFRAGTSRRAS